MASLFLGQAGDLPIFAGDLVVVQGADSPDARPGWSTGYVIGREVSTHPTTHARTRPRTRNSHRRAPLGAASFSPPGYSVTSGP